MKVLSRCLGLNNKIDPVRIIFDSEGGLSELAVALNVDIDSSGRISRRKGYTKVVEGNCHSLFPYGDICFVVKDGSLSVLYDDFSVKELVFVGDRKVSYASVGDRVYFMNGVHKGYICDEKFLDWNKGDYVGPDTTKVFYGPPLGSLIEVYNGYMFIADKNVLWYSLPFNYHLYDIASGFILFDSDVTMLRAVRDGLYVSSKKDTFYLKGANPGEFVQTKICDYSAIKGTDNIIDGRKIRNGEITERLVIWASSKGICIGGPEGIFENLTERKLVYSGASKGTGCCIDNRYVSILEAPDN